ncbi:MAG: hypothetical protein RBS57_11530, partial [Desulforhabdus sp.]|nr:hypothetical protein [Desulforhabdus sp.]
DTDPSYGLRYAGGILDDVGLGNHWAYYDEHTSTWYGPCGEGILDICSSADLLLNRAGVNPLRPWFMEIPVRALIDVDPVFTQIRNLKYPAMMKYARQHTAFFSLAENIRSDRSSIPDDGLPWQPIRHPVFLKAWPALPCQSGGSWTTVMQWKSYPAEEYEGVSYGMKSESLTPYLDVPKISGESLELVVGGAESPRQMLTDKGWVIRSSREISGDPWVYRKYIQQSKGEFSVAKQGYVQTRSGWFSERSAAYLASGRPVVTEEAGFSDRLPTGAGLVSFSTPGEALASIEEVGKRYEHHCKAARALAEEFFDARKILPRLIERAMEATE